MGEQIKTKVRRIGRTARLLVWGWAVSLLFAIVVAVLLFFGAIDYLFRQQDIGMRYLVFTGALAAIGLATVRLCRIVSAARFSELDVAQLIERRVTGLGDRLSSALSFLKQSEQLASPAALSTPPQSLAMQRAVIDEASQRLAAIDAGDVFDYRAFQRAALLGILALTAVLAISLVDLQTVLIGTQRVLTPWSAVSWPRRNELYFENRVDKLAQGADFIAVVKDGKNHLPSRVQFEFAFLDQESQQTREMNQLNDTMVFRLDNISGSFRYRAVGGDDETNWYVMDVLPAPRIEEIEFQIKPPSYTHLNSRVFAEDVKAIVGSSLKLTATCSERLRAANVRWTVDGQETSFPARIGHDGKTVTYPVDDRDIIVESSGVLRLEVVNADSLSGGLERRFQIVAIPDVPPTIDVAAGGALGTVTLQGKIDLRVAVREDIRLEQVDLVCTTQRLAVDKQIPLFRRDPSAETSVGTLTSEQESGLGERYETDIEFEVSTLGNLQAGDVITLFVAATDAKQQTAISNKLNFRIADATELIEQLLGKQNQVYEKLLEGLRQQDRGIKALSAVRAHLDVEQAVDASDANGLHSAQLAETEVARQLGDPQSGAAALLKQILQECAANAIDRRQFVAEIEKSYREVSSIVDGSLADTQFQLASAIRLTRQSETDLAALQDSLARISQQQLDIAARLEELVGRFSQIDELREAIKTWIQLKRRQAEIFAATKSLSLEFVGKTFEQLTTENRQRIGAQADLQAELARNSQQAVWELDRLAKRFDAGSSEARVIEEAARLAATLLIDSQMREASEDLRKNQLGKALGQQEQLMQSLDRVLEALQGSRSAESENKLQRTAQANNTVKELLGQQSEITGLIKDAQTADKRNLDNLLRDAEAKQREIANQLQQLHEQLQADENSSAAQQADEAEKMAADTAEKLSQQELSAAERSSQATERVLQDLQRTLDRQIQREESRQGDLRNNQAKALLDELIEQQGSLLKRFQEYRALDETQKQANRPRLQQFAGIERELSEATQRLAEGFAGQIALSFVYSQVVDHLDVAAQSLQQSRADDQTEYAMSAALVGLERIRKALNHRPTTNPDRETPPDENQAGQESSQIAAAEVALLLESQQSILDRTAQIELSRKQNGGELSAGQMREIKKLFEQEAELVEIVKKYLEQMQAVENQAEQEKPEIPDLPIPQVPGL